VEEVEEEYWGPIKLLRSFLRSHYKYLLVPPFLKGRVACTPTMVSVALAAQPTS
jgi:hypothetical protein